MKKIKEVKFRDGRIGEYYETGEYREGLPSALFFWKGDNTPTRLCLDISSYAYTHAGRTYKEACDEFPPNFSQEGGDAQP